VVRESCGARSLPLHPATESYRSDRAVDGALNANFTRETAPSLEGTHIDRSREMTGKEVGTFRGE
jgi:hypothetical protein